VVKDKGYEILYLTESVDEFAIQMLMNYEEKQFKSVSASDLDIETPEEKEETKKLAEDSKDMFSCLKEALGDKVKEVRLSERLKTHPCCLTNEGQISLDMEKTFAGNKPESPDIQDIAVPLRDGQGQACSLRKDTLRTGSAYRGYAC